MKEQTVQKLVAAMIQMRTALSDWIKTMDVPEEELMSQYDAIIRENGEGAKLLRVAASMFITSGANVEQKTSKEIFERLDPEEYAKWLRLQTEPLPEQLAFVTGLMKDLLPSVREVFLSKAKEMPRYKHGGRPKELDDPKIRQQIREEIKSLREPRIKLQELYPRLAQKHGVSATTIKRIWLEGSVETDEKTST